MSNYQIHITGRVQGVGFRPFIYNLAKSQNIYGWVRNGIDGVHIEISAKDFEEANDFYHSILENAPEKSIIKSHSLKVSNGTPFNNFSIYKSSGKGKVKILMSPDFALCENCKKELLDSNNRRYGYPFITCTKCGPRFSIIKSLPYDRERTSMMDFTMCPHCENEYDEISDRRYYSQTNSCQECPVSMILWDNERRLLSRNQKEIIDIVKEKLFCQDKIVAIKGIGGYLLMANACSESSIMQLRNRKKRLDKPFALMYPNLKSLNDDTILSTSETNALLSEESPIVLVRIKEKPKSKVLTKLVAPGLDKLGVMLPYTGLYEMIMQGQSTPVIATSANLSNAPIVYEDDEALRSLNSFADYIVSNDRQIMVPQDDSVVSYTSNTNRRIILRRSRGLAPSFKDQDINLSEYTTVLAMGAELKGSFSIFYEDELYTSQYLGDLSDFDSERSYKKSLNHFFKLLGCNPDCVLVDMHPDYAATRLGQEIAALNDIAIRPVQHHKAHFAAILAENKLIKTKRDILGVIWDGTGYGEDGNILGGEFFLYSQFNMSKAGQLDYFTHLAGDKMAKEPRLPLMSLLYNNSKGRPFIRSKFTQKEFYIYSELMSKEHPLRSSSMGRLFDAVASLLGISDSNAYEGQAAMLLEKEARNYINSYGLPTAYDIEISSQCQIPTHKIVDNLLEGVINGEEQAFLAARFHVTLVEIIERVAELTNIKDIAFSGGVFQNALLVELIENRLNKKFNLYFHKELSPNDENISYGQMAYLKILELGQKESIKLDNIQKISN